MPAPLRVAKHRVEGGVWTISGPASTLGCCLNGPTAAQWLAIQYNKGYNKLFCKTQQSVWRCIAKPGCKKEDLVNMLDSLHDDIETACSFSPDLLVVDEAQELLASTAKVKLPTGRRRPSYQYGVMAQLGRDTELRTILSGTNVEVEDAAREPRGSGDGKEVIDYIELPVRGLVTVEDCVVYFRDMGIDFDGLDKHTKAALLQEMKPWFDLTRPRWATLVAAQASEAAGASEGGQA